MGTNRRCDDLGLGESAAHAAPPDVPLADGGPRLSEPSTLDRLTPPREALQSLVGVGGGWLVGSSVHRWLAGAAGVALPSTDVLVVGGALLVLVVVGWWLLRRRARRRAALAEELARLNEEISAVGAGPSPVAAGEEGEPRAEAPAEASRAVRPAPASIETVVTPDEVQPGGRSVVRLGARVTTTEGEPVAGVRLRMVVDGGPVDRVIADRTTVTDPDGCASLEVRVPLIAGGRRLYFTAEVTGTGEEHGTLRARTWVRVRDIALEVRPDRPRVQRGEDGGVQLLALVRDDAGEPVQGIELRSEVVDAGGGTLTPETAETDVDGRVEFLYGAGERVGEVRVRIWPEGEPRLAREIVVEQVE